MTAPLGNHEYVSLQVLTKYLMNFPAHLHRMEDLAKSSYLFSPITFHACSFVASLFLASVHAQSERVVTATLSCSFDLQTRSSTVFPRRFPALELLCSANHSRFLGNLLSCTRRYDVPSGRSDRQSCVRTTPPRHTNNVCGESLVDAMPPSSLDPCLTLDP